jgi:TonB family protein
VERYRVLWRRHLVPLALVFAFQAQACSVASAQSVPGIFQRLSPSVVLVASRDADDTLGFGSGVVLSPDGLIATNHHVIEGAQDIAVKVLSGKIFTRVMIVYDDPARDLAVLVVPALGVPAAALADSDAVQVGEAVLAIGNPQGLEHTLSTGIVSGVRRVSGGLQYLQTTVPLSSGSSGGPLINLKGEVIGIAVGVLSDSQNLNFAIPSNDVRRGLNRARAVLKAREERLARQRAEEEAARRRLLEEERQRRIAEATAEKKALEEEARRRAAEASAAKKAAEEGARRKAADATEKATVLSREVPLPRRVEYESPALDAPGTREPSVAPRLPPEPTRPTVPRLPEPPRVVAPQPVPPLRSGAETPGGVRKGGTSIDVGDFPFDYYLRMVQAKIAERWAPPRPAARGGERAIIMFEIGRDGSIKMPILEKSSGLSPYDQSALRAVAEASPFPPLPPEFKAPSLRVHFGFEFQPDQ